MRSTAHRQVNSTLSRSAMIEAGIRCAHSPMVDEDDLWSRYSNDKTDIGEHLARVIRTLSSALPLNRKLRALSIGSSSEPQFRILETAFRGGLYLLDIDPDALDTVRQRIERQDIRHVHLIATDYNELLREAKRTQRFRAESLGNRPVDLITLHHSLYYCDMEHWKPLFSTIHQHLLARTGAMHAVLMAPSSRDPLTTTSLYNRFAGTCFGIRNNQSLSKLKRHLERLPEFRNTQMHIRTSKVRFYVDDFVKFMKVVWMILLYPDVHDYSEPQKKEITAFVYDTFYAARQPLLQEQHHLVLYRGIGFRGLG